MFNKCVFFVVPSYFDLYYFNMNFCSRQYSRTLANLFASSSFSLMCNMSTFPGYFSQKLEISSKQIIDQNAKGRKRVSDNKYAILSRKAIWIRCDVVWYSVCSHIWSHFDRLNWSKTNESKETTTTIPKARA